MAQEFNIKIDGSPILNILQGVYNIGNYLIAKVLIYYRKAIP